MAEKIEILFFIVIATKVALTYGIFNRQPNNFPPPILRPEDPLGDPISEKEFEEAISLKNLPEADSRTAVNPDLYEGDIDLVANRAGKPLQSAIKDPRYKWPGSIMPYVITQEFSSSERLIIARGMAEIMRVTCIQFRPKSSERDYVKIQKGRGCSSAVGRVGGEQLLSLGDGCIYSGIVQHELMHALGFWHEQSRPDRDNYVVVNFDNVIPTLKYNFNKKSVSTTSDLGLSYDYYSLMHYGQFDFTRNGRPTIVPHKQGVKIGQRNGLSASDTKGLNLLYKCHIRPVTTPPPTTTSKPSPKICRNKTRYCRYWAFKGYCKNSAYRMNDLCPEACGKCNPLACEDKEFHCNYWSRKGECKRNPNFMTRFCPKSCNICQ